MKPPKQLLLTVKVTPEEMATIKRKAQQHTAGNVSTWVRYATTELDPRPKDMEVRRTIKE